MGRVMLKMIRWAKEVIALPVKVLKFKAEPRDSSYWCDTRCGVKFKVQISSAVLGKSP